MREKYNPGWIVTDADGGSCDDVGEGQHVHETFVAALACKQQVLCDEGEVATPDGIYWQDAEGNLHNELH